MKFIKCNLEVFLEKLETKQIICFGVSNYLITFSQEINNFDWMNHISCMVDNNVRLHGVEVSYFGRRWKVFSPQYLRGIENAIIIIPNKMNKNILEIAKQLQDMNLPDNVECYSLRMLKRHMRYDDTAIDMHPFSKNYGIEKIIHCCWFSKEKKPLEYQKCIDSWKVNCPDYEIKEWNSHNYDIEKNKYMKQAYEQSAWAFVSDYARLDLVYNHGGIYLDMDVEILKKFDSLLKYKGFFSFYEGGYVDLGSGFGAVRNLELIRELLNVYDEIEFSTGKGEVDFKKVVPQPLRLLPTFQAWGYEKNMKSQLIDDVAYFSPTYFKVIDDSEHEYRDFQGTEYAIHWHHAGWFDEAALKARKERILLDKELLTLYTNT